MAQASLVQVKDWFSVPGKPVTMGEIKALSSEDRDELRTLVGEALGLEG